MISEITLELFGSDALAEIMDANPVPCFVIDVTHRVIHWNKGCEQILGFTAAEMIGTTRHWQPFYAAPRPTLADLIVDQQIEGAASQLYKGKTLQPSPVIDGAYVAEDFFPDLRSGSRRLFFTAAPIHNNEGEIIGAVETLQDVTLERQAEQVLRESNARLEELVASRTAELAESNRQLSASLRQAEEANRVKSAFLDTVSQELKSPLHGIIGIAELLQMDHTSGSTHDYARIVQENGEALFQLIDNMLSLTGIEAGEAKLTLSPYSIEETLVQVAERLRRQAEAKGLTLQTTFSPTVPEIGITDAPLMTHIVSELIDNAIKFTPSGQITLTVDGDRRELLISVTDTGPGIPIDQQALIFEKFRQVEDFNARRHGGLGLGLALARARAELLGGQLTLEPLPANVTGARFTLRLPENKP